MSISFDQLIFAGFSGVVVAVSRANGSIVWTWKAGRSGYTTLLLEPDLLVVSVDGYLTALDPLTGKVRWQNDLPGLGVGVASLASANAIAGTGATAQAAAAAAAHQVAAST